MTWRQSFTQPFIEAGKGMLLIILMPYYLVFGMLILYHHCKEDLKDVV